MTRQKHLFYIFTAFLLSQSWYLNAGLFDWLINRNATRRNATQIRKVPSIDEQECAYKDFPIGKRSEYVALEDTDEKRMQVFANAVKKLKELQNDLKYLTDSENRKNIICRLEDPLETVVRLSHMPKIRSSDAFQELKSANISDLMEHYDKNKHSRRAPFPINKDHVLPQREYARFMHWDNIYAIINHLYLPKKPIKKELFELEVVKIKTYYAKKRSHYMKTRPLQQLVSDVFYGKGQETIKMLHDLSEKESKAIALINRQYKYQCELLNEVYSGSDLVKKRQKCATE